MTPRTLLKAAIVLLQLGFICSGGFVSEETSFPDGGGGIELRKGLVGRSSELLDVRPDAFLGGGGIPGGGNSGPDGRGGAFDSMQLEGGERFAGRDAGGFGRYNSDAEDAASVVWQLKPSRRGPLQWTKVPGDSEERGGAEGLAQRVQARLQRARSLRGGVNVPPETLGFRQSRLEAPGVAPNPAPEPAPNPAPNLAPNPAPGPMAPAYAPSPTSLPPVPVCPNISVAGLQPSADRKTAYSDSEFS